jgi:predicted unusual protein kinase regulating ubiquinone biosynthesis (AarF/ABC1/UbiB family)/nucleotide-binding universal stress UspA family protein
MAEQTATRAEPDPYQAVRRVGVGTDRSESADRAVRWAASFAERFGAELVAVQVIVPQNPPGTEAGAAEATRMSAAANELERFVQELAGPRGSARVVVDEDPARAIVEAAEDADVDVLVVGNLGMAGRKEFLLGNVPNRISHNARCTVIIYNGQGAAGDGAARPSSMPGIHGRDDEPEIEPRLLKRGTQIASVMGRHGVKALFERSDGTDPRATRRRQAKRLRAAMEELGPTFAKLGQILSTRPDLIPEEYIEELATLQDRVKPLTEAQVVAVMEEELGVPWEDVFETIEATPMAAGTIAEVHRATLADGSRVVVKVQRPNARDEITQDLGLLEIFAERAARRPSLRQVVDIKAVFEHLSESLKRELDFRQELSNIQRMRRVLEPYDRLGVPEVYEELSTSRLLVMQEIQGGPIRTAPDGEGRRESARQLLESYYSQILTEGFFHADPHPGNLMWWDDKIYLLDFGMVGEVSPGMREQLIMLLMAFWQSDVAMLTDLTLALAGGSQRSDINIEAFREALGGLVSKQRGASLKELQLGPILQEMTEIAVRYDVAIPAALALTGKALAQMQLATAELDPDLDPFDVAGSFLMRSLTSRIWESADPKRLFYEAQKLRLRFSNLIESIERLTGARPGPNLQVNFGAEKLERTIRRAGRHLALGITGGAAILGTATTINSENTPRWVPAAMGALGSGIMAALMGDLLRRHH